MDCITCGFEAGYNRAVVDTCADEEVGGFCLRCERAEFGNSLQRGYWTKGGDCVLCDRDGFYALPTWEARAEPEDGCLVSTVDYAITDETVRLCDEHLHAIRRVGRDPASSRRSRRHGD